MPHVSKHHVKQELFESIFSNFIEIFASLKNKKECRQLIINFFSKTERLMFAKRLAIIFMLNEEMSHYSIAKSLKVSESTVSRISLQQNKGELIFIDKFFKNRNSFNFFMRSFLNRMPKRGKGRWGFVDKY